MTMTASQSLILVRNSLCCFIKQPFRVYNPMPWAPEKGQDWKLLTVLGMLKCVVGTGSVGRCGYRPATTQRWWFSSCLWLYLHKVCYSSFKRSNQTSSYCNFYRCTIKVCNKINSCWKTPIKMIDFCRSLNSSWRNCCFIIRYTYLNVYRKTDSKELHTPIQCLFIR